MNPTNRCICGKISHAHCAKCGRSYCSKECQTFDWIVHRHICGSSIAEKVLGGEILYPVEADPLKFSWRKVDKLVGYVEFPAPGDIAKMEFVSVWYTSPEITIYMNSMTRYGKYTIILQWQRDGKIWSFDTDVKLAIFERKSMEKPNTDKLIVKRR